VNFSVDPDITRAATFAPAFYGSEAAYAATRDRVFARTWQWLGDLTDVAEPGSLAPRDLLRGLLDEPLLLTRDAEGTLRCLSNVCTHRANILVTAPRRADHIRCGYHSRRFDLAGRMTFMPEFADAKNFPSPADNLPNVPFAQWSGHGFAALDPAASFAETFDELRDRLAWLPLERYRHDPARDRNYELGAHWALYVENYLEGFHIPFVHGGLNEVVDYGSYATELFRYSNLQRALAQPGEAAFDPPRDSPEHGQRVAAYYGWIFPNLMLNFYPWGLSVNLVQPDGPRRTRVAFRSYVGDATALGKGAGGALDRVEAEDEAIVHAVQRGVGSRFYRGGRYSPTRERGVHHFHRLLAEFLAA
jgi:choline monooxygenase